MAKARDQVMLVACVVAALGLTVFAATRSQSGGSSGSGSAPTAQTTTTFGAPRPTSARPLLAAVTRTMVFKTAMVRVFESMGATQRPLDVSITGAVTFDGALGEFTYSIDGMGDFNARLVRPDVYVQPPAAETSQLAAGKSWLEVSLNQVNAASVGSDLRRISASSAMYTQYLSYLRYIDPHSVELLGPQLLAAVATTEYQATVDLATVAAKDPPDRPVIDQLEAQSHQTKMTVQVWVNSDRWVQQVGVTLPLSPGSVVTLPPPPAASTTLSPTAPSELQLSIYLSGFGTPVQVVAPPPGQVDHAAANFDQPL